ncbi:MAG: winged helix-turn-helix domain-containing protein [Pelosinus sp.]|nr:winged helix-turn-helix domain-containing protein [Pelosinus sp.]
MITSYQQKAINICKRMVHLFYIEKDIEPLLNYFNAEATWIGPGSGEIIRTLPKIKEYFRKKCAANFSYTIISENYFIGASSCDSCIVIANIHFRNNTEKSHYRTNINISMYFQIIEEELVVSHYHVSIPIKPKDNSSVFFIANPETSKDNHIQLDVKRMNDIMENFVDTTHIGLKSFYYKDDLPYRYINQKYLELLNYSNTSDFLQANNTDSLSHIYPDDREKYVSDLKNHLSTSNCGSLVTNMKDKTYYSCYRALTQDNQVIKCFEWGIIYDNHGSPIINSFVLPFDKALLSIVDIPSEDTAPPSIEIKENPLILGDTGIHVGDSIVIYPRKREVYIDNKAVNLTPLEFSLLSLLLDHVNNLVPLDEFYEKIWASRSLHTTSGTLKMHISHLRHKLNLTQHGSIHLSSIHNKGYCLSIDSRNELENA